jgi:hypothetical protein
MAPESVAAALSPVFSLVTFDPLLWQSICTQPHVTSGEDDAHSLLKAARIHAMRSGCKVVALVGERRGTALAGVS